MTSPIGRPLRRLDAICGGKSRPGWRWNHKGFGPSTLVYWRKRLARSKRPHRINEAVRQVVEQTGILRGRRKRAVDSTILDDAVATQDTITQLISAIRRVMREVPGAAELVAAACTGHDYSQPGKPRIDWGDPGARDALVSALVNDANALVDGLTGAELDERGQAALALLALVAGQDVEPDEGSDGTDGRWRIARKVAHDRVVSTVDPEARHTRKSRESRRDGYRAHVAAEPETGIVTDERLTPAAGTDNGDPAVATEFLDAENAAGEDGSREWYGDSAYGTGDLRGAITDAGHHAVIKPMPLQAPVDGGFTLDDCPLRARCTTSKTGRRIVLHEHDAALRAARRDWAADPDLRDRYRRTRPNVERVISQIASRGGRRLKLRYRGTMENNAWLKCRTAALNLRNLIGQGLTRTAGAWNLAT